MILLGGEGDGPNREVPRSGERASWYTAIFVEYTLRARRLVGVIDIRNKMFRFYGLLLRGANRRGGAEGVSDLITIGYVGGLY